MCSLSLSLSLSLSHISFDPGLYKLTEIMLNNITTGKRLNSIISMLKECKLSISNFFTCSIEQLVLLGHFGPY